MARANQRLIEAISQVIAQIQEGAEYQWGHMGACNCGHLAQALTSKTRREIHAAALLRAGDWGQQSIDYCPSSGMPLDAIISEMLEAGLTLDDIDGLERLNGPHVLARLPLEQRWMKRNDRDHLVRYLRTWRELLEEQWSERQSAFLRDLLPGESSHHALKDRRFESDDQVTHHEERQDLEPV